MADIGDVIGILRHQAWERAKGELNSVLDTYHGGDSKFDHFYEAMRKFVDDVDNNGWAE